MSVLPSAKKQEIPAFNSQDDSCPQCKSERYLNPTMKLLVGPCYHKLCEACVIRTFDAGPAPCPECQRILRKNEFYQPIFEDLTVENEVRIRARMAQTYNKRQEDFKSLSDYNDYLEMVEELTLKQLYEEDADQVDYIIERYKRENIALIEKNQSKQQREDKLSMLSSMQRQLRKRQEHEEYLRKLEEEEREKIDARNSVIEALATSDKDAKEILKQKKVQLKKSSLSHRSSTRKAQLEIEALLRDAAENSDDDMDQDEADDWEFDPEDSPYESVKIELRSKYDDPTPAFRQGSLTIAGVTREMHQRYLIEGALAGLFEMPLTQSSVASTNNK
ncbi:TFIIH/NER complex subunit [Coemansia sp. Benny D115]|nr:TFIIH/NER complex subunit [Coemansia sp. Benny D115]